MDDKSELFNASPKRSAPYGDGAHVEKAHSQTQLYAEKAARAACQSTPYRSDYTGPLGESNAKAYRQDCF